MATSQTALRTSQEPSTSTTIAPQTTAGKEAEVVVHNHNQVFNSMATQTAPDENLTQSGEKSQEGRGQTDKADCQVTSTATQSSTWDELATELVLEVITQQVTKIRGMHTSTSGSSCVHIDGMTWKDIVAMIVQTHNKMCAHTGVKLHHNMVGMTSSIATENDDDGKGLSAEMPPAEPEINVGKEINLPKKQKSPNRKRNMSQNTGVAKGRTKVVALANSQSKSMTPFEAEFQQTVENILTKQDTGDSDAATDKMSKDANQVIEEIIDITQCPDCKMWFKSKAQLKKHSAVHSKDEGPRPCKSCEMIFPTEWDLQKHAAAAHKEINPTKNEEQKVENNTKGEERAQQPEAESQNEQKDEISSPICHSCDSCNSSFKTKAALKKHQQVHKKTIIRINKEGKIIGKPEVQKVVGPLAATIGKMPVNKSNVVNLSKCQVCKKHFRSNWQLEKHKKVHSASNGEHLCPDCGKSCRTEWNLQRHILIHAKVKQHKCKDCDASFGIMANLLQHRSKVHNAAEAHACEECGMTYKNKVTLKYHKLEHTGSKSFQCNVCNKAFPRPDALRLHQAQHKPKKFNCTLCPKAYPYRSLLIRHWQYSHSKEETVSCKYCDKTFQNYYQKNSHEEIHTGHRQYTCQTCGKGFHQKSSLLTHERLHTGEKPFKCTICNKAFVSKSHVTRHEKSHNPSEERKKLFKCSFCETAFHWKHQWQDHENRHKGIKPHKCAQCQAAFVAKCDLNRHMKIHSSGKGRGHTCAYCDRSFSLKQTLERHEVEQHLHFEMDENDRNKTVIVVMKSK